MKKIAKTPGCLAQMVVDAAGNGQFDLVEWFLSKRLLDEDVSGRALCAAAYHGQIGVVNLLLQHGSDVHYHNDAPLFWAVDGECLAIVNVLLRQGATSTVSSVCWAAANGNHRCLALLMSGTKWHYHDLRVILRQVGSAGENLVECARIVIRHCSDAYLVERLAEWDESVCAAYPEINTLKLLALHEQRFRLGSK